jgi:hypothetical protein
MLVLILAVTMALMGAVGFLIEKLAYRPLRNAPKLAPLITAIGVSFILQNIVQLWKGPYKTTFPQFFPMDAALILGNVRIGLINRAVPDADLDDAVAALAGTIAAKSAHTIAIGKAAFHRQRDMTLADAYAETAAVMVANLSTADAAEGIAAFLERRAPTWTGR